MSNQPDWHKELSHLLTIASQKPGLLDALLRDLLTPEEYDIIAKRWQIIKRLHAGQPQRDIARSLNVGIATVSRGSRTLQEPNSGLKRLITMILTHKNPKGLTKAWRSQLEE